MRSLSFVGELMRVSPIGSTHQNGALVSISEIIARQVERHDETLGFMKVNENQ